MLISKFIFSWIRFRTHEIEWSIQLLQVNICKSKHIFFSNNRDFPTTHLPVFPFFSPQGKPAHAALQCRHQGLAAAQESLCRKFKCATFINGREICRGCREHCHWQCSLQIMANFEIMHDVTLHCQPCRQLQCVRF